MASSPSLSRSPSQEAHLPRPGIDQNVKNSSLPSHDKDPDTAPPLASTPETCFRASAPEPGPALAPDDVFGILRRSIADESAPADSVIRAVSEAARILTLADGVALAFRTKGVILCRARSGDLAPDLGSYVNANSGISGECLRTASILVCQDAGIDTRVDNLVCERMGVRSIVVVPLRGPVGISGILEVFSKRVDAFGNREINCLRGLAELAEAAYERERREQLEVTRAALRSAHRLPALLARAVGTGTDGMFLEPAGQIEDPHPERLWWAIGVATVALLLILGVWLSWHGPISELTELEAAENRGKVTQAASQPREVVAPAKPEAGIFRTSGQKVALHASAPRSQLSSAASKRGVGRGQSHVGTVGTGRVLSSSEPDGLLNSSESLSSAPDANIDARQSSGALTSLISDRQALPVMAPPVSRGRTQGELIHKVDPVYPLQARTERLTGAVVLEVRIAENGTVRDIRTVSGDSQLAGAAVEAVRQWQYAPTLLDGSPIETTRQVTVIFKLP